jgi:hypothetical protein
VRFARVVFVIAGVWGLIVLPPLYFMADLIGRSYPPPIAHPDFYYGFLAVTLAWQVAFLVIATDPRRFRPMMIPAMAEKFAYVVTLAVLSARGALEAGQAVVALPDLVLGSLFVAAFFRRDVRISR